jgi:hypothetical protein
VIVNCIVEEKIGINQDLVFWKGDTHGRKRIKSIRSRYNFFQ